MTGQPVQPRPRVARLRSSALAAATALLGTVALLVSCLGLRPVGAQSIEDARAEADALADDLAATRERLIELAEEYNRATEDLVTAQAQIAANRKQLDANQAILDAARGQLRDYALEAYITGGGERELDGFFGADANTVDQRLNYIKTAAGNRRQLMDEVNQASRRVERQLAQVEQAERVAAGEQARLDAARTEAAALEAETEQLLDRARGRLADLVAEAEARRAEEERQAALAAARDAQLQLRVSPPSGPAAPPPQPVAYTPPPGIRPEAAIALSAAMSQLGVPYVWGGASPSVGFDCSGLIYWAYGRAGVSLSRPADYQRDDAVRIAYEDLQPGDLVFYGEPPSHVGMYIGNDEIINAPQSGGVVSIKTMFYSSKPMTYGRVV